MFNPYDKKNYRFFLIITPVLFLLCLYLIFVSPTVPKGIELSGGTIIRASLEEPTDPLLLEKELSEKFALRDLSVNLTSGPLGEKLLIQFSSEQNLEKARASLAQAKTANVSDPLAGGEKALETINFVKPYYDLFSEQQLDWESLSASQKIAFAETAFNNAEQAFSTQLNDFLALRLGLSDDAKILKDEVGATLGESFYQNAIFVSVIAFAFLSVVVFLFFREIVPSFTMLAAAVFDITAALAMMAVLGIPLTLATIPALLTVIGYSVDTEILLTTRIVKRKDKEVQERAKDAVSTGLAMTSTILATLLVMIVIAYFGQIGVMFEISVVLFFGLLADVLSTWTMSAPIILMYVESKHGGSG